MAKDFLLEIGPGMALEAASTIRVATTRMTTMPCRLLLIGLIALQTRRATPMGHTYSVQEMSQEFTSPGAGDPANYAPWAEEDAPPPYILAGSGNYVEASDRPYFTYQTTEYPSHYVPSYQMTRYSSVRPHMEDSHIYQESMPSIHAYKPSFSGKDFNEYPHILPPGGKSIEQLQQEADFRLKKIYFDSRENQKVTGEKIHKLKESYGYGTIGYPGYKSSIRYEPIDLGSHNAIDLGTTLDGPGGGLRLPLQTVRVTKTLGVRVPEPYPVRHEVPVPAPFPVPVTTSPPRSHQFDDDAIHTSREVKQYLDAFASEFVDRPSYARPETIVGKSFRGYGGKRESGIGGRIKSTTTTTSTTPAPTPPLRTYTGFRPNHGAFPSFPPRHF